MPQKALNKAIKSDFSEINFLTFVGTTLAAKNHKKKRKRITKNFLKIQVFAEARLWKKISLHPKKAIHIFSEYRTLFIWGQY